MFNFKVMSTAENKKLIIRLRKKNKTYQEIADIIGKSRQRIHQIYKYPKEAYKKGVKSFPREKRFYKKYFLKCLNCKNTIKVTKSSINTRKFCSIKCKVDFYHVSPEQRKKNL